MGDSLFVAMVTRKQGCRVKKAKAEAKEWYRVQGTRCRL